MIISHLYKNTEERWVLQSNEEHSVGVARLASHFASEFGMSEWGKVLGQLHDKGKESHAFQQHIKKRVDMSLILKFVVIITMLLLVDFLILIMT